MPNRPPIHNPRRRWIEQRQHEAERLRLPPSQRGYDRHWRKLRVLILQRDHYICQNCGTPAGASAHVDHIIPLSAGGENTDDNLQTLCHACHSRKTAGESGRA